MTKTIVETEIVLPTDVLPPTREVPSTMILFGLPKCGKTTELSKLPNLLNIDVEEGSNLISMRRIQPPKGLGPVGKFQWLKRVAKKIKDEGNPYDFVAIETISYLDELSEWVGTWNYMNSIAGKSFNRVDGQKGGIMLESDHPDYQSVHSLPEGYGYRHSREAMTDIFDTIKDLGKVCTIMTCHVVDKYVISKQTNTEVRAMDLSLTGKVKNIYSRDVDAIGYVYNKGGKMQISFKGSEERLGGMRGANHIQGYEGPLDWNLIFKLK